LFLKTISDSGRLADADTFDLEQRSELFEFGEFAPDADGAVVCGAVAAPLLDKGARADGEAVAAVGVADFEDLAGHGFAFRNHEAQAATPVFGDGQKRDRAAFDAHFDRQAAADFSV